MPTAGKNQEAILAKFTAFARMMAAGPLPEDAIIADLADVHTVEARSNHRRMVIEEANRLIYDQGERYPNLKHELMEIIDKHFEEQS